MLCLVCFHLLKYIWTLICQLTTPAIVQYVSVAREIVLLSN